ncbi:MAG: hypothetical protein ACXWQQ_14445 [Pseudobdellovibrio sp.]
MPTLKSVLFFLLAFLFQITVFAGEASCASVDLRASMGPARDQGITMWCYAHSAADLVSQKLGVRVSAFDMATTYLLADVQKLMNSRDPLIQQALHRDPDFIKRLKRWRLDDPSSYTSSKILTEFGFYYLGGMDQDAILLSSEKGFCLDEKLPGSDELFQNYLKEISSFAVSQCGSGGLMNCQSPAPLRIGEVTETNAKSLAALFQKWTDFQCGERIKPRRAVTTDIVQVAETLSDYDAMLKSGKLKRPEVLKKLFKVIDKNLNSGKSVSIGYDLMDVATADQGYDPETGQTSQEVDHSSVIAARRFIDGQCRYFVRTHLGNSCPYLDEVKGLCEADAGGLWVTPAEIKSLYSVINIRD